MRLSLRAVGLFLLGLGVSNCLRLVDYTYQPTCEEQFDFSSDPQNCGACGVRCGEASCINGSCQCLGELPDRCGQTCRNFATDRNSCGSCSQRCPNYWECRGGTCVCEKGACLQDGGKDGAAGSGGEAGGLGGSGGEAGCVADDKWESSPCANCLNNNSPCKAEAQDCQLDVECVEIHDCISQCTSDACSFACTNGKVAGAAKYWKFLGCMDTACHDKCYCTDCGVWNVAKPCGACMEKNCLSACSACTQSASCVGLLVCLAGCAAGDTTCESNCFDAPELNDGQALLLDLIGEPLGCMATACGSSCS